MRPFAPPTFAGIFAASGIVANAVMLAARA
jgi:hypothetical protein